MNPTAADATSNRRLTRFLGKGPHWSNNRTQSNRGYFELPFNEAMLIRRKESIIRKHAEKCSSGNCYMFKRVLTRVAMSD